MTREIIFAPRSSYERGARGSGRRTSYGYQMILRN